MVFIAQPASSRRRELKEEGEEGEECHQLFFCRPPAPRVSGAIKEDAAAAALSA